MTARRTQSLLELDADLGQLVPEHRRGAARLQLQVDVHGVSAGPWSLGRMAYTNPEHVGLLLLEGVVSREVVVADTISTELLGPGDVVRPWAVDETPPLLEVEIRWKALTDSRVAVLDRRFANRLTQWPEVNSVLIDRLNARAQRLATAQAISQLNRVDRRVLTFFWHLADRWGRMTPEGVLVPLTLSHRMLGQLVGARRPTISTAVAELARRDELIRRENGTWLIKGEPAGLSRGGSQREIPIRRRLLAAEPTAVEPRPVAEVREPIADDSTAGSELRMALARLRSDSQRYLERLREAAGHPQDTARDDAERLRTREFERDLA